LLAEELQFDGLSDDYLRGEEKEDCPSTGSKGNQKTSRLYLGIKPIYLPP